MTPAELNARMMDFRDAGLVSDNASCWEEVAPCDQERALAWLESQKTAVQEELM